ncbi:MAG TPA: carbamate kinase [Candidatus Binatia bacterium]|nr:carbamate kinase [Candidatus Binatia bacterium]
MTPDSSRALIVVALGGNAISPPAGDLSFATERAVIARAAAEIARLALRGARLLVVHGNGPQVGRLLCAQGVGDPESLDVHVAQTQGELGYLLAEALEASVSAEPCAALVTRVLVDPRDDAFRSPSKPVGAVLMHPPLGAAAAPIPGGHGFRRLVASPRPIAILESEAIRVLLATHHVVAGGGGGVALAARQDGRVPQAAVIDKDWVAALLAIALDAERLFFVTDVPCAFDAFGSAQPRPIGTMAVAEARRRLASGVFLPGSMAPKVESAAAFVEATGRAAIITTIAELGEACEGRAGTVVRP